jgi:hypothetical protein
MRLPIKAPARATSTTADTKITLAVATRSGITPAGCCAQVCVPVLGCHCVAESPFC